MTELILETLAADDVSFTVSGDVVNVSVSASDLWASTAISIDQARELYFWLGRELMKNDQQ